MNDPEGMATEGPIVRLGLRGLDNLTNNMIGGGLYVLVAETPSARFPLLANSLGSAIREGLKCTVIVPANPESFLQRIQSFDRSISADVIASRRLELFVMQDDFAKTVFRYGAEGFVKELDYFEIPTQSYLIFDQADELLSLHDISLAMEQVDIIGKWLQQQQITALLSFSRVSEADADTINALMDNLTGIARLGGGRGGLELTFDYWQSPDGTVAAKNYHLSTLESGLYEASSQTATPEQNVDEEVEADPEEDPADRHYFYMDPDLGSVAKVSPGVWQRIDTFLGLMHATSTSRSATVILKFQADTNLRQLAEAVHTLRLGMGRRAHIVVQEKNASLRYQNESLLLRLGVNLIVHKDVSTSRMPLLLESLKGQVFNRDVNINFEEALTSVTPSPFRGYLLPARFAREVNVIVERAGPLNIPYAMIIGQPAGEISMVDVLKRIKLTRTGDLFTADSHFCYIFLNACPQTVLLATVARIFGGSIETALASPRFLTQRADVDLELTALVVAAERGDLPDYSALMEHGPEGDAAKAQVGDVKSVPAPTISAPLPEASPVSVAAPPVKPNVEPAANTRPALPMGARTVFEAALATPALKPQAPPAAPASTSTTPPVVQRGSTETPSLALAPELPPEQPPGLAKVPTMPVESDASNPAKFVQTMATPRARRAIGPPARLSSLPPTPPPAVPPVVTPEAPAVAVFGKKEAPRATRSAPPPSAAVPATKTPPSEEDLHP